MHISYPFLYSTVILFFFKQKTAYEMRISDWSSDVCSSDLAEFGYHGDTESYDDPQNADLVRVIDRRMGLPVSLGVLYIHAARAQIGRASCGERVCQYV